MRASIEHGRRRRGPGGASAPFRQNPRAGAHGRARYISAWKNSMSTGTRAEQITPLTTESTTVSPLVQRIIMGSVVSSLVAPAGAMQVG